jgi:hypothetical protein
MRLEKLLATDASDRNPGADDRLPRPPAIDPDPDFRRELDRITEQVKAMGLDTQQSLDVMAALIERTLARQSGPMRAAPTPPEGGGPLPDPYTISPEGVGAKRRSPYLDAEGAAAYLGITLNSLYGVVERVHLTPLRGPRRRYRFTTAMLDDYLGRGRTR